jgi:hypothetical protein
MVTSSRRAEFFLAWVDVGLFLVDRILSPTVKAETARFVLSDPASTDAPYFCRLSSAAIASRQGVAQGPNVGAYAGRTRRITCIHGSDSRIAEAHIPPPVRKCDRSDAARILPRGSHRACGRTPDLRKYPAKDDRPIAWLSGRGFLCTRVSQSDGSGAGRLSQAIRCSAGRELAPKARSPAERPETALQRRRAGRSVKQNRRRAAYYPSADITPRLPAMPKSGVRFGLTKIIRPPRSYVDPVGCRSPVARSVSDDRPGYGLQQL